jgi:hypothetical protein
MNKWLKVIIILVALAVLLLLAWMVVQSKTKKNNDQPGTSKAPELTQPKTYTSTAKVKQVNPDNIQVEVPILTTGTDGFSVYNNELKTINVGTNTKYFFAPKTGIKKAAKLTDIKPNLQISVTSSDNLLSKSTVSALSIDILQ